jgi:hypothetical protein
LSIAVVVVVVLLVLEVMVVAEQQGLYLRVWDG